MRKKKQIPADGIHIWPVPWLCTGHFVSLRHDGLARENKLSGSFHHICSRRGGD